MHLDPSNQDIPASRRVRQWLAAASLLAFGGTTAQADITYTLQFDPASSPEAQQVANSVAVAATFYNQNGSFNKHWNVYYNPGIPTAEGSYSGYMGFGGTRNERVVFHEAAHTFGMGQTSAYSMLISGGTWGGQHGNQAQFDTYNGFADGLHGDGHAIWPGGFNYNNEDGASQRHWQTRIMAGIRADMGILSFTKEAANEMVHPGETARFEVASPMATTFQWSKNGVSLTDGGPISGATTPILQIANAGTADAGTYRCTVMGAGETLQCRPRQLWVSPRELLGEWRFDGDATDSAKSNHGTAVGSPGYVTGKVGQAIDLDGIDDHILLPGAGVLSESLTVATWINWDGGNDWQRIFDFGTGTFQHIFLTPRASGGATRLVFKDSFNGRDVEYSVNAPGVPVGQWVHLAAVLNGGRATLYVNGKPAGTTFGIPVKTTAFQPTQNYIGRSQYSWDPLFNGRVDDFRVYNHALGGDEIWALWGESPSSPPAFTQDVISLTDATEGSSYGGQSLASHASDPDSGSLTFSKIGGPAWLSVAADGTLSGVPGFTARGANVFVVRATDPDGATSDAEVRINVNGVLAAGPVARWNFDDGSGTIAADSSGNSRDGTLLSGALWGTGISGGAVDLDGSDDHVSFPTGIVETLTDFTISLWINPDTVTTWARALDFGTGTTRHMFIAPQAGGTNTLRFTITAGGGGAEQVINGTSSLAAGTWTHVVVTHSGNTGRLYVNGNEVGSNTAMSLSPSSLGSTTRNWLGRSQYPDPRFDGRLDELQIYERPLSQEDIRSLAGTASPSAPSGVTVAEAGQDIILSWAAVPGATSYQVKRATVSGGPYTTIATIGTTSFTDAGSAGGAYDYVITASNGFGESAASSQVSTAQPPPAPWTTLDIGSVGITGSTDYRGGVFTVEGSGTDIWGTADGFQYVSQTLTGDGEIRARVTSITNTDPWAKAGVMIRDGSGAGATNALMTVTAGNGFSFQWRSTASAESGFSQGPATNPAPNNWVRLVRSGSLLTGYYSADGVTWTQQGTTTITMGGSVSVGLAVTSHNNSAINTATFDNVSVTPYPSPWLTMDVGTTGLAGAAEFFGDAHTVKGAGTFGGSNDGFRYVYQTLSADGSIVARVSTLGNTGTSARVGIMMRDTLAANSRMAALTVNGSGAWRWQRRTTTGGSVTNTNSSSGTAPNLWVRLVRSGNTVTASRSTNGTSWTTIGSTTVTMASNCYVGLAVASGTTTTLNTSVMDNLTVVP